MSIDRQATRRKILAVVREMAQEFPEAAYTDARERFGLLGKIRTITGNVMPTARQCWEYVGLHRSHLVDEFEFSQQDNAERAIA
ncbi:hypothetical protein [Burkholderia multivorans]|uniref:hypothetical protein n=1 Tax=Burkholderia multivorans TaxID=87883 RepID=UPI001589256E|nr:hypothetical protein [Burkholderia multivorans]MDR8878057.1 hypothetical protein [Burkholderia multivorans]MDR8882438.1 hypothetical protein [Burkholderia multivorans]MDR8889502.1 hypothetical protein [Burkholderia multivorans]MDR8908255.1 hypothetical protein [Burkholderia multivorans]MDR8915079.1 hypothetical protein [Burkholderia multivorans]